MSRLIVVSNRVAVPQAGGKAAAGGLAVAVNAALNERPGIWFGWSGRIVDEPSSRPTVTTRGKVKYAVIDLKEDDFQEYYNGFANRVLWPILHYRVDLAEFQRSDLSGYIRVNRIFADHVSKIINEDDVIWIHDYHMMPLAKYLREKGHKNKIGFFLHIPMPPADLIQALPRHGEIIGSLAHYDLVGFQTEGDRDNFGRYLESRGGRAIPEASAYEVAGRRVRIGAFPVAIESQSFARRARHAARTGFVRAFQESLAGRKLILGVDRLDYSKGIPNRLEAYENLLRAAPEWHNRMTFVQVTPRSRTDVPEYAEMDRALSFKAGQINGRYGDVAWTPLRYVNKTYSRSALAGFYRAADVAVVTPLRDGMNLVAKEFVAAQDPEDPGVLVLSQFAGAASELGGGALLVNPHDTDGVAGALRRALEMPLEERQERYGRMMAVLKQYDIAQWASSFLNSLSFPPQAVRMGGTSRVSPSRLGLAAGWSGEHRAEGV